MQDFHYHWKTGNLEKCETFFQSGKSNFEKLSERQESFSSVRGINISK